MPKRASIPVTRRREDHARGLARRLQRAPSVWLARPPDPERVALLREALALALTTLTPVHPAALVGALATELIFERDIAGREAALIEYETPIAQLDSEALATLREGAGNRRFAGDRPYLANVVSHRKEQLGRTRNLTDSLVTAGNLYFYSLGLGDRTGVDIALESLRARSDRAPGIAVGLDLCCIRWTERSPVTLLAENRLHG